MSTRPEFSIVKPIYGLYIDKDELKLGNCLLLKPGVFVNQYQRADSFFNLSHLSPSWTNYTTLTIENIKMYLGDFNLHQEIIDNSFSVFRKFLLVACGDINFGRRGHFDVYENYADYLVCQDNKPVLLSKLQKNLHHQPPSITLYCDVFKQYHSGLFSLISKNRSEIESKLYKSIIWLGESLSNQNIDNSFLQIAIALECLLSYQEKGSFIQPSIAHFLAETAAFLYSTNLDTRKKIFAKTKDYYAKRSSIVHSGQSKITLKEEYDGFFHIVKTCLYNIIALIQQNNFRKMEEIYEYIKNEKFSHETRQKNRIETIDIDLHTTAFIIQ